MSKHIVHGTMLRPGISKNKRHYTAEAISKAHNRISERLASGDSLPLTMMTSHDEKNVLQTVGKVTAVSLTPEWALDYEAEVPETTAGRDLVTLLKGGFLKGNSIVGRWVGDVKNENGIETAPDIEVVGCDYTHFPGVEGAAVHSVTTEAFVGAGLISESEEGLFTDQIEETEAHLAEDSKEPYGDVPYADPGWQPDKKKRYPLDTKGHVRAAWSYINVGKNAAKYTAPQLKRIKSKIKSAAKKFGIDITAEHAVLADQFLEVLEAYASMSLDNGQGYINVSGYTDEPADLTKVAGRIAHAAIAGMTALDPDNDGDIDLAGGHSAPPGDESAPDDEMESALVCDGCGAEYPEGAMYCPTCGQPVPEAESSPTDRSPQMGEKTTGESGAATEEAPKNVTLTEEQFKALLATVSEQKAPAATATEGAAAAATTTATSAETSTEQPESDKPKVFSESDVMAIAAQAAKDAATAAVESLREETTSALRQGSGFRRGLDSTAKLLGETEHEMDAQKLAEMSVKDLDAEIEKTLVPLIP